MKRTFFLPSNVIADGDFSDGASTTSTGEPWDVTPDAYDNAGFRPAGDGDPQVDMLTVGGARADIASYGFGLVIDREFQIGSDIYATKLVWHPTSMDNFVITIQATPIPLTFIADETGAHVWMRTQTVVARRVPN